MSNLARWQQIALERAVTVEMATVEVEQAEKQGDFVKLTVADRYLNEARRMLTAACIKVNEFQRVAAV